MLGNLTCACCLPWGEGGRAQLCPLPHPEAPLLADCPCRAVGKGDCPLSWKSGRVLPNSVAAYIWLFL